MSWRPDNKVALENDLPRADVREKVTGQARFTTDHYPPNMIWAGYVRCPHGHARLIASNEAAARAVPGMLECRISRQEGRYAGERLGHLCAETREAYEAAMAALDLKFEVLKARTDINHEKSALAAYDGEVDREKLHSIFEGAQAVVERTYQTEVQTHCCLEPHVGMVDFRGDRAVAWGSTQGTFSFRNELDSPLGLREDQIEFHCEYVGGGFGSKFGAGPEGDLAARMSRKYNRPCRVELTRKEEMQDTGMRPGSVQYLKVGLAENGTITGVRIHTWGSVGHSGGGGGVRVGQRYNFGYVAKTHEDVNLDSGFPRPMRAPGHPQGMFGEAMIMDELAAAAGIVPLAFCKLNDPSPVRREMYDVGAELIGWSRRRPDGTGAGPRKRGFGIGAGDWHNQRGRATVDVHVYRNGRVEVFSGSQDIGTGFRTVLRDVVAHQLQVPAERVSAKVGVSSYPPGPASGGSKTSRIVAPRAFQAAEEARVRLFALLAGAWNVPVGSIRQADGVFTDGAHSADWEAACRLIPEDRIVASASDEGSFWKDPTNSEAVQFAEVEVDVETGIVRVVKVVALQAMGLPVNRLTAENQICGAVVQGLSFALFENRILERQTGAMINANMEWYKIAGPVDVPEIVPVIWLPPGDVGVNSLGEPPVIPTAGAIGCAVANAIGARVRSLPITPDKVLAALEERAS